MEMQQEMHGSIDVALRCVALRCVAFCLFFSAKNAEECVDFLPSSPLSVTRLVAAVTVPFSLFFTLLLQAVVGHLTHRHAPRRVLLCGEGRVTSTQPNGFTAQEHTWRYFLTRKCYTVVCHSKSFSPTSRRPSTHSPLASRGGLRQQHTITITILILILRACGCSACNSVMPASHPLASFL